jgi:hypothetical protein
MNNFVQADEHDVYMYTKFECVEVYRILQEAIKHKSEFGQDYCKDLLTRVPRKFISYFYEFFLFYMNF